ncbi:hypothetical protein DFQ28_000132 [Apophysomyces sp. BC1034]|nr:hypothetical protein DFQ30_009548 [Apophysomyces sp. BC1015]KAG0181069.1 hypothetical protein DFQ29_009464 [Apophysomyces sp. BC1021]KAG0191476.1 hypothetical protein DFQ28_000132 [Apophysomyces sp. BC1034]
MFKSRKKRQQLKANLAAQQPQEALFRPLDEIQVARDFRTSLILPELGNDLPIAHGNTMAGESTLSETQHSCGDATRQYQDLAAWRAMRNQNRYSNSLFGGKQRGRPRMKTSQLKSTSPLEEETDPPSNTEPHLASPPPTPPEGSTPHDNAKNEHSSLELLHEYENDNESVENYFFQDFAPTSDQQSTRSKKQTTRVRSVKAMSKFDLASFARHLHENRLSVVQPRESRIIMTEEDEKELEMLLKRKSKFDPTVSTEVVPTPPLPTKTESIKEKSDSFIDYPVDDDDDISGNIRDVFPENTTIPVVADSRPTTPSVMVDFLPNEPEKPPVALSKKPSLLLQKLNIMNARESKKIMVEGGLPTNEFLQLSASTSEPSMVMAPYTVSVSPPRRNPSISSNTVSRSPSISASSLRRSPSVDPVMQIRKSQSASRKPSSAFLHSPLSPIQDEMNSDSEGERKPRKSVSMDGIGHILREQVETDPENWNSLKQEVEAYRNNGPTRQNSSGEDGPATERSSLTPQKSLSRKLKEEKDDNTRNTKSLGLFGSLRQVSRSRSGSIRGLVRNLSQAHKQEKRQLSPQTPTMSRAAMAVIQHNAAQRSTAERSTEHVEPSGGEKSDSDEPGAKAGGVSLISHLLAKASKRKTTKTVNMDNEEGRPSSSSKPSRAQVVRRTIIYVQPDSANFMKTLRGAGDEPPLPSLGAKSSLRPTSNETSISLATTPDGEPEYSRATKVTRQASVKKRIVERETGDRTAGGRSDGGKKWHLESVHDDMDSLCGYYQDRGSTATCLQGLELREMSDGTVVWGVVQKQGNRKSFYAHKDRSFHQEQEEEEADSDNIEAHVLALMGLEPGTLDQPPVTPPPIPRRSPHRPVGNIEPSVGSLPHRAKHISTIVSSNTDIYYAPEVSLPSLLQMMAANSEGGEMTTDERKARQHTSIEQQLDEMMESFSKHT